MVCSFAPAHQDGQGFMGNDSAIDSGTQLSRHGGGEEEEEEEEEEEGNESQQQQPRQQQQEKQEKQEKQAQRQEGKLWQGFHKPTGAKLYISYRTDRAPQYTLWENGRQILACRIDLCGVPYCIMCRSPSLGGE